MSKKTPKKDSESEAWIKKTADLSEQGFIDPWNNRVLIEYFEAVRGRFGNIRMLNIASHGQERRDMHIDDLFIHPALTERPVALAEAAKLSQLGKDVLGELEHNQRLIVLGDPGSGKSTLVNWLAWSLSSVETHRPINQLFRGLVPIPIILREAKIPELKLGKPPSEEDIISVFLSQQFTRPLQKDPELLRDLFRRGQLFFLFDGIDELPPEKIDWLRFAWIGLCESSFNHSLFPFWRALLTSRIVGYDGTGFENLGPTIIEVDSSGNAVPPRSSSFTERYLRIDRKLSVTPDSKLLSLTSNFLGHVLSRTPLVRRYAAPFDQMRIHKYSENWFRLRISEPQEQRETIAEFHRALSENPALRELRHSPLLLTFMAIVFLVRTRLPDGRALLYREIADAYLDKLRSRKAALDAVESEQVRIALFRLAWQAQLLRDAAKQAPARRKLGDQGILLAESLVQKIFSEVLTDRNGEAGKNYVSALLNDCKLRTGLLVPRGRPNGTSEEHYAFAHLSFQEYFASQHLLLQLGDDWTHGQAEMEGFSLVDLIKLTKSVVWRETFILTFETLSDTIGALNPATLAGYLFDKRMSSRGRATGFGKVSWTRRPEELLLENREKRDDTQRDEENNRMSLLASLAGDSRIRFSTELRRAIVQAILPMLSRLDPFISPYDMSVTTGAIVSSPLLKELFFTMASEEVAAGRLSEINLAGTNVTDLSPISKLKDIRRLQLSSTQISDVAPLSKLTKIETLFLAYTKVRELSPLSKLVNLKHLDLEGSDVTDISPLAKLPRLVHLDLSNTEVADISPLKDLRMLTDLVLAETNISDLSVISHLSQLKRLKLINIKIDDFSPIARLTLLENLDLEGTSIKDVSILQHLEHLEHLDLMRTEIKDISPLLRMKGLRTLWISKQNLSDDQINTLRETIPGVTIN
ncbi:MAG: NACHT domain-containing protein [Verrucomicrobiaceae bacterium]|nr:MAG: NACHT domain-containing protein [Verrucomicrobiaceae bacterium]